jgi:outer membrane protein OmpA-like peptidoglycan-associated protein/tetratricopeptide (TPR) repeat protein
MTYKTTNMKRYIYILALSITLPALMSCQPIYKAQKQMDKYNYAKAIEILKKVETKEKTHDAAVPMLAECYWLQRDIENAKAKYAQAVTLPGAKPETFYYYGKALQATGEYEKARDMFQTYSKKNPSDPRGPLYVSYCDSVLGPWKKIDPAFEVKTVNNINTKESDFGPAINNGELVYASDFSNNPAEGKKYGWTGRGYLNIMKSLPESAGNFWGSMGTPSEFDSKLNQEYHDGPATFSGDGNSVYFTRSFFGKAKREGIYKTNELKIFYATKSNGSWGEVKTFFLNSKDYSVGHPALSADGQSLYFVSDMPGGQGGTDVWVCKREGEGWGKATNLGPTINTKENEMFPTITEDNTLYFSSEGHPGYGAMDIFKTTNLNGNWATPVNLQQPINSSYDDFALAYAPGSKIGFFSSNRTGGVGSDDIYAFRVVEVPSPSFISGSVKEKSTMQPIAGATVFLYNPIIGKVKVLKTGPDGMYKSIVDKPADYIVKAMMPNFIADCSPFSIKELKPGSTIIAPRDLLLDKLVVNKTFKIDNIYYDFDKYNIREDAKPELNKLVQIMKENSINVELGSHTDSRGSIKYNDKLAQNRAESAVKYIVSAGIDMNRIEAHSYGEHQLTNKCADGVKCTSAEHQANRRTEFKVTGFTVPVVNPDQFDPGKYNEGDEIELKLLPEGFLLQCK